MGLARRRTAMPAPEADRAALEDEIGFEADNAAMTQVPSSRKLPWPSAAEAAAMGGVAAAAHLDMRHWTVNHRTCFREVDIPRHNSVNSVEQCHGAFKRRARAWLSSTA